MSFLSQFSKYISVININFVIYKIRILYFVHSYWFTKIKSMLKLKMSNIINSCKNLNRESNRYDVPYDLLSRYLLNERLARRCIDCPLIRLYLYHLSPSWLILSSAANVMLPAKMPTRVRCIILKFTKYKRRKCEENLFSSYKNNVSILECMMNFFWTQKIAMLHWVWPGVTWWCGSICESYDLHMYT